MEVSSDWSGGRRVVCVAGVLAALLGCGGGTGSNRQDDHLGSVSFDVTLAPADARCAVIAAAPAMGDLVTRSVELGPGQVAVFSLSGLPVGMVSLTQAVFTVSCSQTAGQEPAWISDPVSVTLRAGLPVEVTFSLRSTAAGGQISGRSDFPSSHPTFAEFALPAMSEPGQIITGADGNLWFTERQSNQIGRITPAGVLTEFALPNPAVLPRGICSGSDGSLWFTQEAASSIGRIAANGAVREFTIASGGQAIAITPGPDGNLWFTKAGRIGRITPTGSIDEIPVPGAPKQIIAGPDGNLWFTAGSPSYVGRLVPDPLRLTPFRVIGREVDGITAGPDGALWFTVPGGAIGRITTDGIQSFFALAAGQVPGSITSGADGALWFTDSASSAIGRITVAGALTTFLTPSAGSPTAITAGPDGNLWYTDAADRIGRVHP